MNWLVLALITILALSVAPSNAQNSDPYRVINQSASGLAYPSSSYIGLGTLSKTAQQGAGYNPQTNPALPKVNRGAYIGTPGDNLYGDHPDLAQPPKTVKLIRNNRIIYKTIPNDDSHAYTPDPNIPMTYSDYPNNQYGSSNTTQNIKPTQSVDIKNTGNKNDTVK